MQLQSLARDLMHEQNERELSSYDQTESGATVAEVANDIVADFATTDSVVILDMLERFIDNRLIGNHIINARRIIADPENGGLNDDWHEMVALYDAIQILRGANTND